jgi:hypothetical protein
MGRPNVINRFVLSLAASVANLHLPALSQWWPYWSANFQRNEFGIPRHEKFVVAGGRP